VLISLTLLVFPLLLLLLLLLPNQGRMYVMGKWPAQRTLPAATHHGKCV
jgi:hypothetical protein